MMQEISAASERSVGCDSFDDDDDCPPERWAPLGEAAPSSPVELSEISSRHDERKKLQDMEEEQEELNSALLALTTHFAQVQFRLHQICNAEADQKEKLLQDLEEFASRGAPNLVEIKRQHDARRRSCTSRKDSGEIQSCDQEAIMEKQRAKQLQLISQLKEQLEDLERYAYECGDLGELPSSELLQKQKVIIESLQNRVDLPIDQLNKLSHDELQHHVDQAIKRLINPIKLKDQLVEQLKTQVDDLTRFIEFLQTEGKSACTCEPDKPPSDTCKFHNGSLRGFGFDVKKSSGRRDSDTDKTLSLIQSYILSQLGCGSKKFRKNELKSTMKGAHWGDLRACLELAIDKVVRVAASDVSKNCPPTLQPSNSEADDDLDEVFSQCNPELVSAVRKQLTPAIRDLLQHGLCHKGSTASSSMSAFGCFPDRSRRVHKELAAGRHYDQDITAWDIILKFYHMKHGKEFSDAPVRKLTQSFNLDSIGGRAVTSKQQKEISQRDLPASDAMLLSTIDSIVCSHGKLKRSPDAHLKAFISAALNHRKLTSWLRTIVRTREIVEENYASWSYVAKTGFEDSLRSLERLNSYSFCLPVDFAVKPFQNIKDAF